MRSNTLLKEEFFTVRTYVTASDNVVEFSEPWENKRARIANSVEAAHNLPGNLASIDMEEFTMQYGMAESDFV